MFIQAKVLYVLGSEGRDDQDRGSSIYDELDELNLIRIFYPNKNKKEIKSILSILPSKTVFSKNEKENFISLPFISSHISIPIKKEESVWIYKFENKSFIRNINHRITNSFWLSRVHSFFNIENTKITKIEKEISNERILNSNLIAKTTTNSRFINNTDLVFEGSNNCKISLSNIEDTEDNRIPGQIEITSGNNVSNFLESNSSISISESNQNSDINKIFYDSSFVKNAISSIEESESFSIKDFIGIEKDSLSKEEIIQEKLFVVSDSSVNFLQDLPSAIINSTNVVVSSNNDTLEEGEIYLIKNSSEGNYGELSIRKNGNIFINSNQILIGNINRLEEVKPIIHLGYNSESNSVVKGEYLKALLLELIGVNKESLNLISKALIEIKDNFKKVDANYKKIDTFAKSHFHISNVPSLNSSPSTVPLAPLQNNVTSKIQESSNANGGKEIERLQDLVKNIDKILSKFVKTA